MLIMSTVARTMLVFVSAIVVLGSGTVLTQVLPSDFGWPGKFLIIVIVASVVAMMTSTLVWAFGSPTTERSYFAVVRAPRPTDSQEGRIWWWARAGWYSWIVLMSCLALFVIAAMTGILH
jgi:hypothetical protein